MLPEASDLQRRLVDVVGSEHVRADAAAADLAVDGVSPRLAVLPGTQDEVATVLAVCGAAGATVSCRGGGTAMGLGNPPGRLEVVLCLDRLSRVVEIDAANLNVSVEAGVRLADLQAALAGHREFLPLDPPQADRMTVGGLVAANASGPARLLYGTARDWILGLRVALPTGERIRCGGKVIKNVSGYDMNKVFVGSLGTLGVVTEVTFKLLPLPATRATVAGAFGGLEPLARVVARALESQLLPEAMEALDARAAAAIAADLGAPVAGPVLAVSVAGSAETVARQVRDFTRMLEEGQASATWTLAGEPGERAWRALRDVHLRLGGAAEERAVVKIAVPISRTLDLLSAAERLASDHGWRALASAHAGSGVVRAAYLADGGVEPLRRGLEALRAQAEELEGSLVVEAAPPVLKRALDAWGRPCDALPVMRRLKAEFDPRGLMVPGRFLGGI